MVEISTLEIQDSRAIQVYNKNSFNILGERESDYELCRSDKHEGNVTVHLDFQDRLNPWSFVNIYAIRQQNIHMIQLW